MPKISKRWRIAAIVFAVFVFLAGLQYGSRQYICDDPAYSSDCFVYGYSLTFGAFVYAVVNAATWFGLVSFVVLFAYGVRKLIRRFSQPRQGGSDEPAPSLRMDTAGRTLPAEPAAHPPTQQPMVPEPGAGYCPSCGARRAESDHFCASCGALLGAPPP